MRKILLALVGVWAATEIAFGQGLLPHPASVDTSSATASGTLLIGQSVSRDWAVANASGTARTLLSYKASPEVLVVGFFSEPCELNGPLLAPLSRLYNEYKDWRVAFVVVDASGEASLPSLAAEFKRADLPIPLAYDPSGKIIRRLGIESAPAFVVLDEGGVLRYRGPLNGCYGHPGKRPCRQYTRDALDAVIGHVEAVPNVEPGMKAGCSVNAQ